MKPERIRIKIAEACGFKAATIELRWDLMVTGLRSINGNEVWDRVPNYPESHDAMAEARKTLGNPCHTDYVWKKYLLELRKLVGSNGTMYGPNEILKVLNATPLQHAEAFLRAKGLWEDGE